MAVTRRCIAAVAQAWQPRYELALIALKRRERATAVTRLQVAYARVDDPRMRARMEQNFRELGEPVPVRPGGR